MRKVSNPSRLLLGLLLTGLCLSARAEPIATDRPDFVESSQTVGQGRFQAETSVAWERDDAHGSDSRFFSTPTLLRLGVSENWELRLETDGYGESEVDGASDEPSGMQDLSFGAKYHLPDSGGASMALLFHVDAPTASEEEFEREGYAPSVRLVAEWELAEDWGLGLMPGVIYDTDENDDRYMAGIFGIVLGHSLSDATRVFAELAAPQIASDDHGGTPLALDLGMAYLLSDNAQLDFAYSRGLNDDIADHAFTVGFSFRL